MGAMLCRFKMNGGMGYPSRWNLFPQTGHLTVCFTLRGYPWMQNAWSEA
jgi:hypothetical protein